VISAKKGRNTRSWVTTIARGDNQGLMPLQIPLSLGLSGAKTGEGVATTVSEGTELSEGTEDGGDPFSDLTRCGQSLE
jgi:hypothetical protein